LGEHVFDVLRMESKLRKEATFIDGRLKQTSQLAEDEEAASGAHGYKSDMEAEMTGPIDRGLMEVPALGAAPGIARAIRKEWCQPHDSRLDVEGVLNSLGIELILTDLGGGAGGPQGLLTPLKEGGYRIEVDPTLPSVGVAGDDPLLDEIRRHRTRFIVAHELAHTLFYWEGRNGPERLVHDSTEQEQFCDALASALLVPSGSARDLPLHPDSVVSLHRTFDVSVEVAARALIEAHQEGVAWLMVVPDGQEEPWVQMGGREDAGHG
jgi:hypothetical protein